MKKILAVILACLLLSGCTLVIDFGPSTATPPPASGEELTVHYLDVGQADCILLECGGEYMLIDGGNQEDGQMVVSYLQQQGIEELDVVVCTHAHEDHVGGLPSVLAVFPTKRVLSPTRTYSSNVFDKFMYYADQ
jgi:competence protein ComEC